MLLYVYIFECVSHTRRAQACLCHDARFDACVYFQKVYSARGESNHAYDLLLDSICFFPRFSGSCAGRGPHRVVGAFGRGAAPPTDRDSICFSLCQGFRGGVLGGSWTAEPGISHGPPRGLTGPLGGKPGVRLPRGVSHGPRAQNRMCLPASGKGRPGPLG